MGDGYIDYEQDGVTKRICQRCGRTRFEKHGPFCLLSEETKAALDRLDHEVTINPDEAFEVFQVVNSILATIYSPASICAQIPRKSWDALDLDKRQQLVRSIWRCFPGAPIIGPPEEEIAQLRGEAERPHESR